MDKNETFEIDLSEVMSHMKEDCVFPDPELLNFYLLREERKVWFDIEVGESTLSLERMIMLWNIEDRGKSKDDRKPIWIYLMNYGGSFDMEWSLIDMITMSQTPVYTVNMGVAASAAADIFIAGHKRFMTKNARVMIHQGAMGVKGDSQKVFDAIDDYKRQLDKTKQYIVGRTGITNQLFKKHEQNDWWLDSDDCIKYGVCDKVVTSIDEIL